MRLCARPSLAAKAAARALHDLGAERIDRPRRNRDRQTALTRDRHGERLGFDLNHAVAPTHVERCARLEARHRVNEARVKERSD